MGRLKKADVAVEVVRSAENMDPFQIIEPGLFDTDMEFYTVMADGGMARDLLLFNREPELGVEGTNRKASKVKVQEYCDKMLDGRWHLSPQPIIFSAAADGRPVMQVDGQQRLKALVAASLIRPELRVPLVVCLDAPSASMWVVDQGKARTPADFVRMFGERHPTIVSNATRMLYALDEVKYVSVNFWRSLKLAPEAQREFLQKNSMLREGVEKTRVLKTTVMPHVGAVLWFMMWREYGPFKAQEFLDKLEKGVGFHSTGDPAYKVREHLGRRAAEKYPWDGFEQLAVLITAVNAYLLQDERYNPARAWTRTAKTFPQLLAKGMLPEVLFSREGMAIVDR